MLTSRFREMAHPLTLGLVIAFLIACWVPHSMAVERFEFDQDHQGLITMGAFQIFPEKRQGNTLYQNGMRLTSNPVQTILKAQGVTGTDAVVYLYRMPTGDLRLGALHPEGSTVSVNHVGGGYHELSFPQLGLKKIYRILNENIVGVYDSVRTATGVAVGPKLAAFYHIYDFEWAEEQGQRYRIYFFRIHVQNRNSTQIHSLTDLVIRDRVPELDLSWSSAEVLNVRTSQGEPRAINVAERFPVLY